MIEELMLRLLKRDEALRLDPYKDSEGYWTIGIGHLIDSRKGGKLPSWVEPAFPITEQAAYEMCRQKIRLTLIELNTKLPQFVELNEVRQAVLCSMAYQMGIGGLLKFRNTIEYITKHDWENAGDEMLISKWFNQQTPARATRLSKAMKTGEIAAFEL